MRKKEEKELKKLSLEEKREAKLKTKETKEVKGQVMLTPQKGAAPLENPEQQKTQGQTDVASNDSKQLVEVQPFSNAPPNPALQ